MMKKVKFHSVIILLFAVITCSWQSCSQDKSKKSVVILFESDVHCSIDGYAKLAGLRDAVADTAWTAIVSCGDFVQGGTIGAISKGQYIIDVMKEVEYAALTLGNHEFDYKIPRMFELLEQLDGTDVVSANLCLIETGELVFAPYIIKEYGGRKIAFLGLTTPTTTETESYAFFDGEEHQKYDLMQLTFFSQVQAMVDSARSEGAEFVVVLAHLGEEPNEINIDSRTLIAKTTGIDVVLDGHTHNIIEPMTVPNKEGKSVLTAQAGSQFPNIGKLVISQDGKISAELVSSDQITSINKNVQNAIDSIKTLVNNRVGEVICHSEVDLRILDEKGEQEVRRAETNAGDIVTDAYRFITGADIALTNGGGIRNEAKKGDLTYGDIVSMLPYDNYLMLLEVPGSKIIEVLEANCSALPYTDGQFPQVSGLKYTAVVSDHSIRNVEVYDKTLGKYVPLNPKKKYRLATIDYCVSGGGMRYVLKDSKILKDGIMIYYDALVQYITKNLDGKIGEEYAEPQGRITVLP